MKNNILKRFCVLALILCMVSGSVCVSVSAYDEMDYPVLYESDRHYASEVLSDYVDLNELRAFLFNAFAECPDGKIDILDFSIPLSAVEELKTFIWREMPECFHIDGLRIYKNSASNYVTGVGATYKYALTKDEYAEKLAECNYRASLILDGVKDNDRLSTAEKALLIHDRLAVFCNYCYDESVAERYTMYGALVKGYAVCDGYTRAYAYLLRLAGIENLNCASDTLGHSWNLVLIDGNYYHVDVTWDDPSVAVGSLTYEGLVKHTNFLLSNEAIYANKHNASDYYTPSNGNSKKYDNYYWQCSETEFQLVNGQIYYLDNEAEEIKRLNTDRKSGTALGSVKDTWWTSPDKTSYWSGNFSRLSSDDYSLYFSLSDAVYIFDLTRNEAKEIFRPELNGGELIYGFTYTDGYLICDTNDCPFTEYANLKKIKQLYVPDEDISAELSSTVELKGSQTVNAEITSVKGISGYYFGKNARFRTSDVVATTDCSLVFTVTEPGTYYFVAFDRDGKSTEPISMTFCLINLHTNGGAVESEETILTEKNNVFDLPVPTFDGFNFAGWTDDPNAESGEIIYEISDPPLTLDLYAIWKEANDVGIAVKTVTGAAVTVNALDAEGNIIGFETFENGRFVFGLIGDTVFIEITAPDHIGRIYKAEALSASDLETELQLVGDVNGDNERNNKDVTVLFRAVSGDSEYNDAADVNADGEENNKDVAILFRFVSDPRTTLATHSVKMY